MRWFFSISFLLLFTSIHAQVEHRCGADQALLDGEKHQHVLENRNRALKRINKYLAEPATRDPELYNIQVVVHVLWHDPSENLSTERILHQIDILNLDFNYVFRDEIYRSHQNDAVEVGIHFCLAENGIIRKQVSEPDFGGVISSDNRQALHYSDLGGSDTWDPERYLNIWIVDLPGGLLGSATFPGGAVRPEEDGILIAPAYFGSTGSASASYPFHLGRTLTHEVGHYLDLYHPWGREVGDCDEDDLVEDTPPQDRIFRGCREGSRSCGFEAMVNNYMQFSDDDCLRMFTAGQRERMMAALNTVRSGLLSADCEMNPGTGDLSTDLKVLYQPSDRSIYISSETGKDEVYQLRLYNMSGQLMQDASVSRGQVVPINMNGQAAGIYVLDLSTEEDRFTQKLFVY